MPELTLPEILRIAANRSPDKGMHYMHEDGTFDFQSYPQLLIEAESIAGGLLSLGLKSGDKVIIATSDNRHSLTLLWAAILAGIVPTIMQPPVTFSDYNPAAVKLINVFRQLKGPMVFFSGTIPATDPDIASRSVSYLKIPRLKRELLHTASPEDLAFIQYSSGSTGEPKGIMLSHTNLIRNIEAITLALHLDTSTRGGNWMPMYHDMGLIGYHFTPLYACCRQYHLDTLDFVKNPGLWLEMMSACKITITGCPNFGQALVLRHLKRKSGSPGWDFSSVNALLNGAEPISGKIMEEFTRELKKYHFREEAMMPVYGMAEATLAISFSDFMKPSIASTFDGEALGMKMKAEPILTGKGRHPRTIIGVGKPIRYVDLRIVNEQGKELAEREVGHIQVRGESITSGYFEQPEVTAQTFDKEWLKTGDMGFLYEGNLYISGRYKDIIFINGRNFFAHDLENLASAINEVSYGKIIFGGFTDPKSGKEKVIAFIAGVAETKAPDMLHQLRNLLRKKMGIQLDEMILVRSNEIPKTSSGKIQRYKLIQRYLQGDFRENRHK